MSKKIKKPRNYCATVFFKFAVATIFIASLIVFFPQSMNAEEVITTQTCAECHKEHVVAFKNNPHSGKDANCVDCHSGGAKHLQNAEKGTIFSFKEEDTPNKKSEKCMSCHQKSAGMYFASSHGKASLDCTACHQVHMKEVKPNLLKHDATKSCYSCHEDVFAYFKMNERHRLQEGILGCNDCHNPHEPATRERLGGFKDESCVKCHTDKSGPFIYEHGASRIEGCSACHEVHGSPNRHMLKFQNSGELCFSCHNFSPNWHAFFQADSTNCASCHSTIHGSNLDRIFLK